MANGNIEITKKMENTKMENKKKRNNREWLDSLDEKEMLLLMLGLMYSYDNRLSDFDSEIPPDKEKWKVAMFSYMEYLDERLGELTARDAYHEWEKNPSQFIDAG